jgi:hypothetical protein
MTSKFVVGDVVRLKEDGNVYVVDRKGTNPGVYQLQPTLYWVTEDQIEMEEAK